MFAPSVEGTDPDLIVTHHVLVLYHFVLEEPWEVVQYAEDRDADDMAPGVVDGAEVGRLVRAAHRDVAVDGDQQRQVDGSALGYER